jgi:hypothetical protein
VYYSLHILGNRVHTLNFVWNIKSLQHMLNVRSRNCRTKLTPSRILTFIICPLGYRFTGQPWNSRVLTSCIYTLKRWNWGHSWLFGGKIVTRRLLCLGDKFLLTFWRALALHESLVRESNRSSGTCRFDSCLGTGIPSSEVVGMSAILDMHNVLLNSVNNACLVKYL